MGNSLNDVLWVFVRTCTLLLSFFELSFVGVVHVTVMLFPLALQPSLANAPNEGIATNPDKPMMMVVVVVVAAVKAITMVMMALIVFRTLMVMTTMTMALTTATMMMMLRMVLGYLMLV